MRQRLRNEEGQALPLVLFAMFVLSVTTAAVLTGSAVNHRSALVSSQAKQAFALAQHGLADAEGAIDSDYSTACGTACVPTSTVSTDEGTFTYSGTLSGTTWTLYATGTVGGVSRSVSTQVALQTSTTSETQSTTTDDPSIWNTIYVDGDPKGTCMNISGSNKTLLSVPLYTPGSVCMSSGPSSGSMFTGASLEVGGSLSVSNSGGDFVGSSSSRIATLGYGSCSQIVSGKSWPCNGAGPSIWASSVGAFSNQYPSIPTYKLADYYAAQQAGGTGGSSCPAGLFDNDSTLNTSNGNVNLFPTNSSYSCVNGTNTLTWNSVGSWSQGTLTVTGSWVFDGSLNLTSNFAVIYRGGGTLFFSGGVNISGSICGGTTTSSGPVDCSGWNPGGWSTTSNCSGCNLLILSASCYSANTTTPTDPSTTTCVHVGNGSTMQTGIYAYGRVVYDGGGTNQGGVIARTMSISNGSTVNSMLKFVNLPANAPQATQNTTTTTTQTVTTGISPPSGWSG